MSIGDKLRAIDEHAAGQSNVPANEPANTEPAEGSRENVGRDNAGGITNRPLSQERQNQERLPPRGEDKEGGHA